MSHTPGPWKIRKNDAYEEYWVTSEHYDAGPAKIIYKLENARLIAAAPELLTLVRHIVDHHEPGALDMLFGSGWADHAKRVLAKVDGA